jgi:hypothetical protein
MLRGAEPEMALPFLIISFGDDKLQGHLAIADKKVLFRGSLHALPSIDAWLVPRPIRSGEADSGLNVP